MSIGSNIKRLRLMNNMSQSELAEKLSVTDKAVSTWENDIKTPRMGTIQKMADLFGVAKSAIIDGTMDTDTDAELQIYLEELKNRPEMRMLFSLAKGATKEDVEKAVKIIEALINTD